MPAARRMAYAAELTAKPQILEPVFLCEISVPNECKSGVYNVLTKIRGEIFEEEFIYNSPLCLVKAYLPVIESFGFTEKLR